jgi:hypothetical protein
MARVGSFFMAPRLRPGASGARREHARSRSRPGLIQIKQ